MLIHRWLASTTNVRPGGKQTKLPPTRLTWVPNPENPVQLVGEEASGEGRLHALGAGPMPAGAAQQRPLG